MTKALFIFASLLLIQASESVAQDSSGATVSAVMPQAKESNKFSADWRLRLMGADLKDEQSKSTLVSLSLDLRSKYLLTSNLTLDIQPSIRMVSGQNQTVDGADKLDNKILLNQAAAHFTPAQWMQMSAGALSQRTMHTSLLIDDIAFPAARVLSFVGKDSFTEFSFGLESAVPTSTSLSTNTRELEPTPSLNSAMTSLKFQASKNNYWKTSVGYFIYNNLPSAVAQQSLLLGNSVQNVSESKYSFMYNYYGLEASTEILTPLTQGIEIFGRFEYIHNDQALSSYSTGTSYEGGFNFHLSKNLSYLFRLQYFSIAPDAAVAYFNSRSYETNRVGYGLRNYLSFRKEGFRVGFDYSEADVMYTNPAQTHQKFFMLKLETAYASI